MNICVYCEQAIDDDAVFCPFCGAKLTYVQPSNRNNVSNSQFRSNQPLRPHYPAAYNPYQNMGANYQYNPRTSELTILLAINYVGVGLLGLVSTLLFVLLPPIGIITFVFTGLFFWLIYSLQQYNNTARIIYLILSVIGLVTNLISLNIIGLLISIFAIYTLGFHQPTMDLFSGQYSNHPYQNQNYYNPNNYYRNY